MKYNQLGATGLRVSEIGLGCEGFLNKTGAACQALFRQALDAGVNCMDLYSPDPALHRQVGEAIRDRRGDFVLQAHLCTEWKDGQYRATRDLAAVKAAFEHQMRNLGTDYLDVGMIHYVDSAATWQAVVDNGILDYAKELKRQGRIHHIGLSSHNPAAAMAAIDSGAVEVLMFSVNPCYDLLPGDKNIDLLFDAASYQKPLLDFDPARVALYETCQRRGIGITVMKVFGGGDLLSAERSPAGKALSAVQCLHYALTRPAVAAVMCGVHSAEELQASLAYETASDAEKDYAAVFAAFPKISWRGHCMYCGHCAPCPRGIAVADVTKFLNLCRAQNAVPETVREHYAALAAHGGDCIACGACEKRCPFEVKVIANMKAAAETFGY